MMRPRSEGADAKPGPEVEIVRKLGSVPEAATEAAAPTETPPAE